MLQEALRIGELLAKQIQGTIIQEENSELDELVRVHPVAKELIDHYHTVGIPAQDQEYLSSLDTVQAWQRLKQLEDLRKSSKNRLPAKLSWFCSVAACLLIGFMLVLFQKTNEVSNIIPDKCFGYHNDLLPGGQMAELTLQNGKTVQLNQDQQEWKESMGGTFIVRSGELSYEESGGNEKEGDNVLEMPNNTLSVPQGGTFSLILPDGSHVRLNAMSRLSFPLKFNPAHREIYLEGEAYFDVVRNVRAPFVVRTAQGRVQVLGTAFNVNTYAKDHAKVTLVHGSVKVWNNNITKLLAPGEQAVYGNHDIDVRAVDVEKYVAWNAGYFFFNNDNIESIMEQLSRWYGMDVHYSGTRDNKKYGGSIARKATLAEVLEQLKKVSHLRFEIREKTVTVIY